MDGTLIDQLRAAAQKILDHERILVAYAHGSRISGTPRPDSDLDVGYFVRRGARGKEISLKEELGWGVRLTDALGVEVDLRSMERAPLDVKGRTLVYGVRVFSSNEEERVDFERDTLGDYFDYKDVYEKMRGDRLKAMAGKVID